MSEEICNATWSEINQYIEDKIAEREIAKYVVKINATNPELAQNILDISKNQLWSTYHKLEDAFEYSDNQTNLAIKLLEDPSIHNVLGNQSIIKDKLINTFLDAVREPTGDVNKPTITNANLPPREQQEVDIQEDSYGSNYKKHDTTMYEFLAEANEEDPNEPRTGLPTEVSKGFRPPQ